MVLVRQYLGERDLIIHSEVDVGIGLNSRLYDNAA